MKGAILSALLGVVSAQANVVFGPVLAGPGQSVRMEATTTSEGGTIRIEKDGRVTNGTAELKRERDLSWTFRSPEADGTRRGMVTVGRISTSMVTNIGGKPDEVADASPLNGRMFSMSKAPNGDWKFQLDGSVPMHRIDKEIAELTTYLKRDWYPQRQVKLGESWEFDPAWVRMIIERDLKQAQTIGTMKLRQIRHTAKGDDAVIDVSIRSTGGDFRPDGTESSARVELSGQAVVNLKTMLDESLELKGTLVTSSGKPGDSKTVTLPLRIVVKKTIVGN